MPEAYFDSGKSVIGVLDKKELDYRTEALTRLEFYFPTINAEVRIFWSDTFDYRRICEIDGFLGAPSTAKRIDIPQQKISHVDLIIKEYRGEIVPRRPIIQERMDTAKNQGRENNLSYYGDSIYSKLENQLYKIFKPVMGQADQKILSHVKRPTFEELAERFNFPQRRMILG